MIEKNREDNVIGIQDNFLAEEEFGILENALMHSEFPWYFSPRITVTDKESTPGYFTHTVYSADTVRSAYYDSHFTSILEQLNCAVLSRIKINLQLRLPEPYISEYHTDTDDLEESSATQWCTSIFYMNTNNGYTELENGRIIKSTANTLVTFPSNIKHRGVSQTDTQTRILINLNYLNRIPYGWLD